MPSIPHSLYQQLVPLGCVKFYCLYATDSDILPDVMNDQHVHEKCVSFVSEGRGMRAAVDTL